jgi:hypothetical protein
VKLQRGEGNLRAPSFFITLLILLSTEIFPQEKSNLEVLFSLSDKAANELATSIQDTASFSFNFQAPPDFRILRPRILADLSRAKIHIVEKDKNYPNRIDFAIQSADVSYGKVFSDGIFGTLKVVRKIRLSAAYSVFKDGKLSKANVFSGAYADTIAYDDIPKLESASARIAKGVMPEPPYYSSLFEPVLAIVSVVISIYLLFSVRTK